MLAKIANLDVGNVTANIALVIAILAAAPAWWLGYQEWSGGSAQPVIQLATATWTRTIHTKVNIPNEGDKEVVGYFFVGNQVALTFVVSNDGKKTTAVIRARLVSDSQTRNDKNEITLQLDTEAVLAPNGGQAVLTALISPEEFSQIVANRTGCLFRDAGCEDISLPKYELNVDFSEGEAAPAEVALDAIQYIEEAECETQQRVTIVPTEGCLVS